MPIDWDKIDQELDRIIVNAAGKTDEKLASRISSLTRMTNDEVQELFPKPADAKILIKLMKIVKSAENRNIKVNKIVSNAEEFGGVLLSLLNKYI